MHALAAFSGCAHDRIVLERLIGRDHTGSGSVAKEDAGASVREIHIVAEVLCSDDQCCFHHAGTKIVLGSNKSGQESRARRVRIETHGVIRIDRCLNARTQYREKYIWRCGCHDDQSDLHRVDAGICDSAFRRFDRHALGGIFLRIGDVALLDPGALGDPCIVRINDLRQIVVRHNSIRQIAANTNHPAETSSHFSG